MGKIVSAGDRTCLRARPTAHVSKSSGTRMMGEAALIVE